MSQSTKKRDRTGHRNGFGPFVLIRHPNHQKTRSHTCIHKRGTKMNQDTVVGSARSVGGKVQQGVARVTDDVKGQAAGVANQAAGAAQDLYGQAKEGSQDLYTQAKEGAQDAA